jgi:large conductance mechanosensitive channel
MSFLKDFKEFAIRGNVIDLSVGIIVGASFNKIVDVIVNGILLPPIGLITGGLNFADRKLILKHAVTDPSGKILQPENTIKYGELIQSTIVFTITAFAVFIMIRGISNLRRKHPDESKAEVAKEAPPEEKILGEIRDLLKTVVKEKSF